MDLELQKLALQKLLNAIVARMETRLNIVGTKDGNAHSLLEVAQDYCQLVAHRRIIEEELERVTKAAVPHHARRN